MTWAQRFLLSYVTLTPGEGGDGGAVKRKTMSVHRLKMWSGIWSFQQTALKKRRSLLLISVVFSPDILLQAFAE